MIMLQPKEFQALIVKQSVEYIQSGMLIGLQRSVKIGGVTYVENSFRENK